MEVLKGKNNWNVFFLQASYEGAYYRDLLGLRRANSHLIFAIGTVRSAENGH